MMRRLQTLACVAASWALPLVALANEGAEHGEHEWDVTALLASVVNFFLLIVIFLYMGRDKLNAFLKDRKASIEVALNEAAKLKTEAEAKHKEYTERLARLDDEIAQVRSEMIEAGKKERDRILAEAEHKAARMRKESEFLIEQQVKQMRTDLMREATDAAVASAQQLLLKATTQYDQQRLAQEYLAALQKTEGESRV